MINLLPPDYKKQLGAARANSILIRYNLIAATALLFLGAAFPVVYLYLMNSKAAAEQAAADNRSRVSQFAAVEEQASLFRTNLESARQIMDGSTEYTKIILEIARLTPPGVVLENLSLDQKAFGSNITFTARARDYGASLALKDSFQSSPLFSNVYLQSATRASQGAGSYPVSVSLNAQMKKEALR